jgi:hypothetical protein
MSAQEITTLIAAFAAVCSALSAAASWYNSSTFYRQLKNTTFDACVASSSALKAAVHKTIELKANKVDNIAPEHIWGAYDDAWTKWVAFDQAFRIAQRYNPALSFDAPDQTSSLLSQLRDSLRDPAWIPGKDPNDPRDIRGKIDAVVREIQRAIGLA